MIVRVWRGVVHTEKAAEYFEIIERTGMAGYRAAPGNQGAELLSRDLGDGRTEILTVSRWSSREDIKAFAGDDIEVAKYYPEDDAYLVDRATTVAHYDVYTPPTPG